MILSDMGGGACGHPRSGNTHMCDNRHMSTADGHNFVPPVVIRIMHFPQCHPRRWFENTARHASFFRFANTRTLPSPHHRSLVVASLFYYTSQIFYHQRHRCSLCLRGQNRRSYASESQRFSRSVLSRTYWRFGDPVRFN